MKKSLIFSLSLILIVLAVSVFIIAKPNNVPNSVVPENAVEISEGIFSLGEATDSQGRIVEGFMFIDKRKGFHHKPDHDKGGPGNGDGGGSTCFEHLAKGAKWKTAEDWIVNPSNSEGLSDNFILDNLAFDIQKWEDAANGHNILGDGSTTPNDLVADTSSPDDKNEVYFADVESDGAIAVTIVWGIFRGPPGQRELIEWDQIYDDVDFDWNSTGEAGKMDFENIATHELGHSVGMGHPSDDCTEETMYAFADFGETKKRTLEAGDIAGINDLY